MVTDQQLAEYEENGAVVIDSPFSDADMDRAEAAWARVREDGVKHYDDPDCVDFLQHPYFEQVARKFLRAEAVNLWWTVVMHPRLPAPPPYDDGREQWAKGAHVDIQATLEDFETTPRRMRLELWLWLNDVPVNRGAMRILPGSHRPIMEHWSRVLTPEHKAMLPRVHGLHPDPVADHSSYPEGIPELGGTPWLEREPTPVVARRGQVLVLCSAGLHSGWQNEDNVARKALLIPWGAAGVPCGLPKEQCDAAIELFSGLRPKLRPERAHIVADNFDWIVESNYEPKWPETYLPA